MAEDLHLEPGEFVLKADQVRQHGKDFLDQLNNSHNRRTP